MRRECYWILLREKTRASHESLEAHLNRLEQVQDRSQYTALLSRFFGFVEPFENTIRDRAEWAQVDLDIRPRLQKTRLLAQDLSHLGLNPREQDALPRCGPQDLPSLHEFERVIGALYVLEGSTLGGQVICRTLGPRLGLTAETGLSLSFRLWRFDGHDVEGILQASPDPAGGRDVRKRFSKKF